jgi:hypothetical protein
MQKSGCNKDPDSFSHNQLSGEPGRRKPQSEKLQLTLDVLRKESANPSPLF